MRKLLLFVLIFVILFGKADAAEPTFEISGWIPYWRVATGTADTLPHLDLLTEVNPFGYTVRKNGGLNDAAKLTESPWPEFMAAARAKKVRVIPSVMWSDSATMHKVLSNPISRGAHITEIVARVEAYGFDGIDIDYEAKLAETRSYFSLFLKELYARMGKHWVMCTIEARTPLTDRYDIIPANPPEYANDFVAINKYCDRVRFMTYDQGRIDLKLNAANADPYTPISDPKWVEKTINLAAQTIPKRKIALGIPTYGYEWMIQPTAGKPIYDLLWSFNYKYATSIAETLNIIPTRNSAGELSFSYVPTSTPVGLTGSYRVLAWPDAQSIADHITLAKKLGIRGVAIFKFDGGEDQRMWGILR